MASNEAGSKPTHRIDILKPGQFPLDVRAMIVKAPEIGTGLHALHNNGVVVERRRLEQTPKPIRKIVHAGDNADSVIRLSLTEPSEGSVDTDISVVRETVDHALIFSAENRPLTDPEQSILDELNGNPVVKKRRDRLAQRRLKHDRPEIVKKRFTKSGILLAVSAVVANVAESYGGPGAWMTTGLTLAQATDDTVNTVIIPATEQGGKKKAMKIVMDSLALLPVVAAAAATDYSIIPPMLESPSVPIRLAGGFLYGFFAVAGSVGANVAHIVRTERKQKKIDPESTRLQRFKHALTDNVSDPFRKNIWYGSGITLASMMTAAGLKVLVDKEYSGFLQTILGVESMPAFVNLFLADHFTNAKEYINDKITVKRSRKPIEIYSQKR